jgi:glutamate synthase domain-containing protein 3
MGCLMMRTCHTNGCPVGVATQDPRLRARFAGEPAHVVNFFTFVARELREIMARLGYRTVKEMIGQVDRLTPRGDSAFLSDRGLDFHDVLHKPAESGLSFEAYAPKGPADSLDDRLLSQVLPAIESGGTIVIEEPVKNTDRAVGAKISSRIVRKWALAGLPDDSIHLKLKGIAGQSFGAFLARGLTIELEGEANDYVGKGLSGGKLIVKPPRDAHLDFQPSKNAIVGNVALYGATGGELYLSGLAGERFAVRNSGALAVVEGVGDHGCEYMTGGRVAVLGLTGVNFAAGMSGGLAYVYDQNGLFDNHCNLEMVDLDLLDREDEEELKALIGRHLRYTGSEKARRILSSWAREKAKFIKVFPMEYRQGINLESRLRPNLPDPAA